MSYTLKRLKHYWAHILNKDKVVAECWRGSRYKWNVVIRKKNDPEKISPFSGPHNSLEEAFNTFISHKDKRKTKSPR